MVEEKGHKKLTFLTCRPLKVSRMVRSKSVCMCMCMCMCSSSSGKGTHMMKGWLSTTGSVTVVVDRMVLSVDP